MIALVLAWSVARAFAASHQLSEQVGWVEPAAQPTAELNCYVRAPKVGYAALHSPYSYHC